MAESWTKISLNQKDPENLNVDQKGEQGKLVKTVKGMSCLGLDISFVSVDSFSAKDSGVIDLTVIHDGQDFEVMSVEEDDLNDSFSFTKALLNQRDLARSVEKCKEKLNRSYNGRYFSFEVNIRTSTPVESLELGPEESDSGGKKKNFLFFVESKSKPSANHHEDSPEAVNRHKIKAALAKGGKKVGDGEIFGFAAIL